MAKFDPNSQRMGAKGQTPAGGSKPSTAQRVMRSGPGTTAVARNHPQKLRG